MIEFKQIYENDTEIVNELTPLWINYMRELYINELNIQKESDETITEWLHERVKIQGQRESMHFECILDDGVLIGFGFYALDLGGIRGIIDPGFGYIMEMYIVPNFRRKKYGTRMYEHMVENLKKDGASLIYLTPDTESGVPFWKRIGFTDSGKIDPDNKMPIYIKEFSINDYQKS